MFCILSGNLNSMIYLPVQDESKSSSKGEMPFLGGEVVKIANLLKQIYIRLWAVWLYGPTQIRQSGSHSFTSIGLLRRYAQL